MNLINRDKCLETGTAASVPQGGGLHNRLSINPSFSVNPPYRSLSFFSFRIHYLDFPDCLLLLLSISVFFTFLVFFCFYTFLVVGSVSTYVGFRAHVKIAFRIVSYRRLSI